MAGVAVIALIRVFSFAVYLEYTWICELEHKVEQTSDIFSKGGNFFCQLQSKLLANNSMLSVSSFESKQIWYSATCFSNKFTCITWDNSD